MASTRLGHRGVIEVSGGEARDFLDRIVTCDVAKVAPGRAAFGALLSPQGKILADFLLLAAPAGDGYLLDVPAVALSDLTKRLGLYRLRARITIADRSGEFAVAASWGEGGAPDDAVASAADPRLPALGWRAIVRLQQDEPADAGLEAPGAHSLPRHAEERLKSASRSTHGNVGASFETPAARAPQDDDVGESDGSEVDGLVPAYHSHRISLGIPEGGLDFRFGDAFPHEAMMDQLGGVAFDKGCYVGQEVVSRMQHRGTARTRIVPVRYEAEAPSPDTDVTAGDRVIGTTGSSHGREGLATLRLDRATDALAAGHRLEAAGVPLEVVAKDWIRFALPGREPTGAR